MWYDLYYTIIIEGKPHDFYIRISLQFIVLGKNEKTKFSKAKHIK